MRPFPLFSALARRGDTRSAWMILALWLTALPAANLAPSAAAQAGDWPNYKHDVQRSSATDEPLAFPLGLAWRFVSPQPPHPAWPPPTALMDKMDFDHAPHPVIAGGVAYFASTADDTVRAMDAKTGAPRWQFTAGGPVRVAPQVENGRIYFACDDGKVYCLDAATGKAVWIFRAAPEDELCIGNRRMISRWPCRNGVLVQDGVAYCVAGTWPMEGIYVYALAADTGKAIWCNDTGGSLAPHGPGGGGQWRPGDPHSGEFTFHGVTPQGPMLAGKKTIIVPQGHNAPAAYSKASGALVSFSPVSAGSTWVTVDADTKYVYMIYRDGLQIFGTSADGAGVRPVTIGVDEIPQMSFMAGRLPFQAHKRGKVSTIVHEGKVYSRDAYGLALSCPPGAAAKTLIEGGDGDVTAVNAQTKAQLWRGKVTGEAREIAIAGGCVYVATSTGEVSCFAPAGGDVSAKPLAHPPRAAATPAPAGQADPTANLLKQQAMDHGYALVLGDADASVAVGLAENTGLQLVVVVADDAAAAALRERLLAQTSLYGYRVHVLVAPRLDRLPFAQYFANAVIVAGDASGLSGKELFRVLRPCGGVLLCPGLAADKADALLKQAADAGEEAKIVASGGANKPYLTRGPLPGARDWNANTSGDRRVQWPMRPIWFGGPDAIQVMDVGIGAHPPVAANGRYFVTGQNCLTAVDAYNGAVIWSRPIPSDKPAIRKIDGLYYRVAEGIRSDAAGDGAFLKPLMTKDGARYPRVGKPYFADGTTGQWTDLKRWIAADGEHVYLLLGKGYFDGTGETLIRLDARTGRQEQIRGPFAPAPTVTLAAPQTWTLDIDDAHGGAVAMSRDEAALVLKLATGDPDVTKADTWDLFFDFRPAARRYGLYDDGAFRVTVHPAGGNGADATWTAGDAERHPTLEVTGSREPNATTTTVRLPWAEIRKLTGDARIDSFGFSATLTSLDGDGNGPVVQRYLLGDVMAPGLNNGWANIILDEGAKAEANAIPAVVAGPISQLPSDWAMPREIVLDYVGDPGKVDDAVRLAPRLHPLTGEPGIRASRSGTGGCGNPVYSAFTAIGRTAKTSLGFYDFLKDEGLHFFFGPGVNCGARVKAVNTTAALGLVIMSESRSHCQCMIPIRTSIAFAPAERRLNEDWAIFFDHNADAPVRQAVINLGAMGDRRDDGGTLWLAYPRAKGGTALPLEPGTRRYLAGEPPMDNTIQLPLAVEFARAPGLGTYRVNADRVIVAGTDKPWLYASGYCGIRKATLTVNDCPPLASKPADGEIKIDGRLDEPAWEGDAQATLPYNKAQIRLRHDAQNLYVGLRRPPVLNAADKPAPWTAKTKGEDAPVWNDDSFEMFLGDSSGQRVVHLGVSASGARYDALAASDGKEDAKWNAAWQSAAAAGDDGMTVEIAIPLKSLRDVGLDTGQLAANFLVNRQDVSRVVPSYAGYERKTKSKYNGMRESLLSLGPGGGEHCGNFTPMGLGKAPALKPRTFAVKLHFAELGDAKPGRRVFDIVLQGKTLLKDFDIAREAGARKAIVKEFPHVQAADALTVEFVPKNAAINADSAPILSAIEVRDEAFHPALPSALRR